MKKGEYYLGKSGAVARVVSVTRWATKMEIVKGNNSHALGLTFNTSENSLKMSGARLLSDIEKELLIKD